MLLLQSQLALAEPSLLPLLREEDAALLSSIEKAGDGHALLPSTPLALLHTKGKRHKSSYPGQNSLTLYHVASSSKSKKDYCIATAIHKCFRPHTHTGVVSVL